MTITKIKYERQFPIGPYLQERIGFEAELGSVPLPTPVEGMFPVRNETPEEAIAQLRQLCENIHKEKYPHLYIDNQPITIEQVTDVQIDKDPIAGHITAINSASNLAALNWHRALVEKEGDKRPELREAFDKKLQELNNK